MSSKFVARDPNDSKPWPEPLLLNIYVAYGHTKHNQLTHIVQGTTSRAPTASDELNWYFQDLVTGSRSLMRCSPARCIKIL